MPTERQPVRQPKETLRSLCWGWGGQRPCKTVLSGTDLCDKHSFGFQDGFLDEEQVRSLPDRPAAGISGSLSN